MTINKILQWSLVKKEEANNLIKFSKSRLNKLHQRILFQFELFYWSSILDPKIHFWDRLKIPHLSNCESKNHTFGTILRGWGGVPTPLSYILGSDLIFYNKKRKVVCCCDDEYKIRHFLLCFSSLIYNFHRWAGRMLVKQ